MNNKFSPTFSPPQPFFPAPDPVFGRTRNFRLSFFRLGRGQTTNTQPTTRIDHGPRATAATEQPQQQWQTGGTQENRSREITVHHKGIIDIDIHIDIIHHATTEIATKEKIEIEQEELAGSYRQ